MLPVGIEGKSKSNVVFKRPVQNDRSLSEITDGGAFYLCVRQAEVGAERRDKESDGLRERERERERDKGESV